METCFILFVGAVSLKAASKLKRSLSLKKEFAQSGPKGIQDIAAISLNTSTSSAPEMSKSQVPISPQNIEVTPKTALPRIQSPNVSTPSKEQNLKVNVTKLLGSDTNNTSSKDGYHNKAYVADNKLEGVRVASAATSIGASSNTQNVSSSYNDLKAVKDKLANSLDSRRSKLSSVDVS